MKDKNPDSPYGIICQECGKQGLTEENYNKQISYPDSLWECPICGCSCYWDYVRFFGSEAELLDFINKNWTTSLPPQNDDNQTK